MSPLAPLLLAGLVDVTTPGVYVEEYDVPRVAPSVRRCLAIRCTSLFYAISYPVRSCLAPVRASVHHVVSERYSIKLRIPIKIEEEGQPGDAGYRWTLQTAKLFVGRAVVTIEIGDVCHDKS